MPHRGSERYFEVGGEGTDDGACVSTYMLYRGVWGMLPPKFFYQIRCSEIAFEAVFVLKFIFGLDAARIPGPSVSGVPLAMLHGSWSLVVTC